MTEALEKQLSDGRFTKSAGGLYNTKSPTKIQLGRIYREYTRDFSISAVKHNNLCITLYTNTIQFSGTVR